jgi:hypothetical protein
VAQLAHPIKNLEVLARVRQQLRVGGMIRIFHRDDHGADLSMLAAQKRDEFILGLCRPYDENFVYSSKALRDLLEEHKVVWRLVAAVRSAAQMGSLMLIVGLGDRLCLGVVIEVPHHSLVMIDPDNRMIVDHGASYAICRRFDRSIVALFDIQFIASGAGRP